MSDEQSKSSPSPSGSSSASDSQSPDALDSASVKQLARALHGLTQRHDDARIATEAEKRKGAFREQMMLNAVAQQTAEMKSMRGSIDRLIKLFREVIGSERDAFDRAAKRFDESAKVLTLPKEAEEEITAEHLKVRWSTLVKWAPFAAKGAAIVAVAAGAVWAFVTKIARHIPWLH